LEKGVPQKGTKGQPEEQVKKMDINGMTPLDVIRKHSESITDKPTHQYNFSL